MAYTVEWTPVDPLLFSRSESDTDILYTIMAKIIDDPVMPDPDLPTILGYEVVEDSNLPLGILDIIPTETEVTLSADDLIGLFVVELIEYRLNDEIIQVTSWADLPTEAEEIITFKPSMSQSMTFSLKVIANLSDDTTEEMDYTFEILQNWDIGRDTLLEELNARSN